MLKYPKYGHETVVLVSVRDPLDLHALGGRAALLDAKIAEFYDEDVTEELSITAVASGDPRAYVLFRSLPLALSGEGVRR